MRVLKVEFIAHNMNNFSSLILPAVLGLVAGIGHGINSHYQELPFSLAEQIIQPLAVEQSLFE